MSNDKIKTRDLNTLLRTRYAAPDYAILFEVANATGARHSGWADAVCMSLWPSRGLVLSGIEVKCSRSDWLRELKKPEKAEPVFKFMDYWWLAAAPDVAKKDEIPTTWGFMEVRGDRLVTVVPAPKLAPKAVDRTFLAALLRRASEAENEAIVMPGEKQLAEQFREGHTAGYKTAETFWKAEMQKITDSVRAFEADAGFVEAGFRIDTHGAWRNKALGAAVAKAIKDDHVERDLASLAKHARSLADAIDAETAKVPT